MLMASVAIYDQSNDDAEITSRLFASIVWVNKLTKLESTRGRHCASSSFILVKTYAINCVGLSHT